MEKLFSPLRKMRFPAHLTEKISSTAIVTFIQETMPKNLPAQAVFDQRYGSVF